MAYSGRSFTANAAGPAVFRQGQAWRGTKSRLSGCRWDAALAPRYLKELIMLGWAITFLLVALVAAFLGFGGIATFAVDLAKIVFFVAIVLFVISAIIALIRGRTPTMP
jgi:uncharacterized membrane protein YtjA (UPF0391 family)